MSWSSIVNQHRVKRLLQSALERDQLAHALLFTGPEGTGKEAMAIELAKVLNCQAGRSEACGVCPDCKKMDALQHPNLNLIFPLPVGKNEVAGDSPLAKLSPQEISAIQEQLASKAANPYHKILLPRASGIKVNSTREIRRSSALTAFSAGKKVYAVFDAEKMNDEAANALLKTLEEPLPDTLIILTTASPDELLPTVISRCQRLRFDLLAEKDIAASLIERNLLDEERALLIAALSRGNFRQALELIDVDIQSYRDQVVELLRTFLYRSREEIYTAADSLGSNAQWGTEKASGKDRQEIIRVLALMQTWFHESMSLRRGAGTLAALHDDTLRKFTESHPNIDYAAIAEVLDETISDVGKNVYIPLLITVLAFNIQKYVLSPSRSIA